MMNGSSPKAVLLPIQGKNGAGHYGHGLSPKETFERLHQQARGVEFISYLTNHWRVSGNFVFTDSGIAAQKAVEIGEAVTGLKCLVRKFSDLEKVWQTVPPEARVRNGDGIMPTATGCLRLLYVALSARVGVETAEPTGNIGASVEILAWPSPQDVLCLYDRKKSGGVSHVRRQVLTFLRRQCSSSDIHGTSRALSVIRNLLENRNMCYGQKVPS